MLTVVADIIKETNPSPVTSALGRPAVEHGTFLISLAYCLIYQTGFLRQYD